MVLHYRVDERVIHGQTTTRITKEFVCNGIIIVDETYRTKRVDKNRL